MVHNISKESIFLTLETIMLRRNNRSHDILYIYIKMCVELLIEHFRTNRHTDSNQKVEEYPKADFIILEVRNWTK